jgi:hypothetical protein
VAAHNRRLSRPPDDRVDDNADAREAPGTLLELEKGHEVKWALSAPEALSGVESFTP